MKLIAWYNRRMVLDFQIIWQLKSLLSESYFKLALIRSKILSNFESSLFCETQYPLIWGFSLNQKQKWHTMECRQKVFLYKQGGRPGGSVTRALAFNQLLWLLFVEVCSCCSERFFSGTPVSPSPQKPTRSRKCLWLVRDTSRIFKGHRFIGYWNCRVLHSVINVKLVFLLLTLG